MDDGLRRQDRVEADLRCLMCSRVIGQLFGLIWRDSPGNVVRGGGPFMNDLPPAPVVVPAHKAAQFFVHWEQVPVGGETNCPVSASLAVTPPDEYVPLTVPIAIRACGGGRLDISAV